MIKFTSCIFYNKEKRIPKHYGLQLIFRIRDFCFHYIFKIYYRINKCKKDFIIKLVLSLKIRLKDVISPSLQKNEVFLDFQCSGIIQSIRIIWPLRAQQNSPIKIWHGAFCSALLNVLSFFFLRNLAFYNLTVMK